MQVPEVYTMKTYYSIGETAKLLGITTQTLRYYEKIGIVGPKVVDEKTGYRYYTFKQFHIIDRIKYLQHLGMSLSDIGIIIAKGTVDGLLPALEEQWQAAQKELVEVQSRIKDIEWYVNYFTYLSKWILRQSYIGFSWIRGILCVCPAMITMN